MEIRQYQAGDEEVQARIYNAAAGHFPNFKPATSAEVARRHQGNPALAASSFYAVEAGEPIGYATFDQNGRISFPWTLPDHESAQNSLLETVLQRMHALGLKQAWAAYRADWTSLLEKFRALGFGPSHEMINYVADLSSIPRPNESLPMSDAIAPFQPNDTPQLTAWLDAGDRPDQHEFLGRYFGENRFFAPDSLFVIRRTTENEFAGVGLVIQNDGYADPSKLDSGMPCFRLGAFGGERERHKRVNGMFSCLAPSDEVRSLLLSEAAHRLERSGLKQIATQARSDQPELVAFYDGRFRRQGSFPIVARALA